MTNVECLLCFRHYVKISKYIDSFSYSVCKEADEWRERKRERASFQLLKVAINSVLLIKKLKNYSMRNLSRFLEPAGRDVDLSAQF